MLGRHGYRLLGVYCRMKCCGFLLCNNGHANNEKTNSGKEKDSCGKETFVPSKEPVCQTAGFRVSQTVFNERLWISTLVVFPCRDEPKGVCDGDRERVDSKGQSWVELKAEAQSRKRGRK